MSSDAAPFPRAVVFLDAQTGVPGALELRQGVDPSITIYLILAFYWSDHPVDAAAQWATVSKPQQLDLVKSYHQNNIKIMVSAGGGSVHPTTDGWDPVVTAKNVAKFVKDNNLDGVDVDWEDPAALKKDPVGTLDWIVTYTQTLRKNLDTSAVVSHSPGAPYFCPTFPWDVKPAQGLYYKVDQKVGSLIDFYNVMFMIVTNSHDYETVVELIEKSSPNLPASSLLEIAHNPDYKSSINKLVIGKPVNKEDAPYGGYMTPQVLAQSVEDAITKTAKDPLGQWKAGIMGWRYHNASAFHAFVDPSAQDLKPVSSN